MSRKLSYEEVREIIEKEGCKLLSTEYTKASEKLLIQCACGEVFEKSFAKFQSGQKQCSKCGIKNSAKKRSNNIETIKNFIEENGCKLLSTEYENNKTLLTIQCSCGNLFITNFSEFKSNNKRQCNNCGNKKGYEKHKNQVTFNCDYCGKECSRNKSALEEREHHFCSKECHDKFQENQVTFNCDYCGKECSKGKSKFDSCEHHFCSKECHDKWNKGENHPNYKPDLTDEEREKKRNVEGYSEWVKAVLKRDGYTCQCCGQYSGKIHAHHINGYNWCKEHRTDIDNGIVLCEECHKEFHNLYGRGNNTISQFREFLFNKYTQTKDLKFLALIENIDLTTRAF